MVEENKIIMSAPRITLKRTSIKKKCGWDIASSSSDDKAELKKIIEMIDELNQDMEKRFGVKK